MGSSRRGLLGGLVGLSTALGGCAGVSGVISRNRTCTHSGHLHLTPVDSRSILERYTRDITSLGPLTLQLVNAAVAEGSTRYRGCHEIVESGVYRSENGYYRLDAERTALGAIPRYDLSFEVLGDARRTRVASDQVVSVRQLPGSDRRALLRGGLDRVLGGSGSIPRVKGEGALCFPTESGHANSRLVPTPAFEYLRGWGRPIHIEVGGVVDGDGSRFDLTVTHRAESPAEAVGLVRETVLPEPVHLESSQFEMREMSILDHAVDSGYRACMDEPPSPLVDVLAAIFGDVDDPKHFSGYDQPVIWRDQRYLAGFSVAVPDVDPPGV